MKPKICSVIAVRSVQETVKVLKNLNTEILDLIELRLDYLETFNETKINCLLNEFAIPVIITLRSKQEGGKFQDSEDNRISWIKKLIHLQPDYVDIESCINDEQLYSLISLAERNHVKTILSSNFTEGMPPNQDLINCIDRGKEFGVDLVKIVGFARQIEHNNTILAINENGRDLGVKTIAFCMGTLGLPSRILCCYYGAPFIYAALDEQVAPGQLSASVMNKFYELLQDMCISWK